MPAIRMGILAIGTCSIDTIAMLNRLAKRGWGSRAASTLSEGRALLRTFKFDLVLCSESLPEGRGYDVSDAVARQSGTLLVSIPLSESCLWLAVVERGKYVLGKRALNASMLESEAQTLLGKSDKQSLAEIGRGIPMHAERATAGHNDVPQRRKSAA
jgi:hypothetical protein